MNGEKIVEEEKEKVLMYQIKLGQHEQRGHCIVMKGTILKMNGEKGNICLLHHLFIIFFDHHLLCGSEFMH